MTSPLAPSLSERRRAAKQELDLARDANPRVHELRDELVQTSPVILRRALALLRGYQHRDPATDAVVAAVTADLDAAIYSTEDEDAAVEAIVAARQKLHAVYVFLGGPLGSPNDGDTPGALVTAREKVRAGR